MKKYRVTEKHRFLKKDTILKYADEWYIVPEWEECRFNQDSIDDWLGYGWIKEIQQPLFTEDDMISFANYFNVNNGINVKVVPDVIPDFFNDWIEWKKK